MVPKMSPPLLFESLWHICSGKRLLIRGSRTPCHSLTIWLSMGSRFQNFVSDCFSNLLISSFVTGEKAFCCRVLLLVHIVGRAVELFFYCCFEKFIMEEKRNGTVPNIDNRQSGMVLYNTHFTQTFKYN